MRYIVITEGGEEAFQADEIDDSMKDSCDMGIMDLIDTQNDPIVQYYEGEWHELRVWEY